MFKMKIETDNSAFNESTEGQFYEIARILRECADSIERLAVRKDGASLYDANGNPIGSWEFKP